MKNVLLVALLLFSMSVFGQSMGDAYQATKEKVASVFSPSKSGGAVCRDDGTGTIRKFDRPDWEIGLRANLLDTPNGGQSQVQTGNWDLILVHNLSNNLFAQVSYGERDVTKNHFEGQTYDDDWETKQIMAGFGIYLTPNISIFGGFGKIIAEDDDNKEVNLETSVEKSIAYDIPLLGNKIRVEFRTITAPQGENTAIEESTGDGGYSSLSISYMIPL